LVVKFPDPAKRSGSVRIRNTALDWRIMKKMLCAGYGRREAVEILLNAGANVHARDDGGLIPLHNACSFGHAEVNAHVRSNLAIALQT
jgi:ankyrin repeat protein